MTDYEEAIYDHHIFEHVLGVCVFCGTHVWYPDADEPCTGAVDPWDHPESDYEGDLLP